MNAYLEIIRPGNAVMAVIAVLLVMLISGNFTLNAFLACIVVLMVIGGGNAINDYFDHKIDKINKPNRPIPSGRISLKAAGIYSLALFAIGTIIAFAIGLFAKLLAAFGFSGNPGLPLTVPSSPKRTCGPTSRRPTRSTPSPASMTTPVSTASSARRTARRWDMPGRNFTSTRTASTWPHSTSCPFFRGRE